MVVKAEQTKMRQLLSDTIMMLCKASLPYKREFSIEGLLGVTLDDTDVFLININEAMKPNKEPSPSPPKSPEPQRKRHRPPDEGEESPMASPLPKTPRRDRRPSGGREEELERDENTQQSGSRPATPEDAIVIKEEIEDEEEDEHLSDVIRHNSGPSHTVSRPPRRSRGHAEPTQEPNDSSTENYGSNLSLSATMESDLPGCSNWDDVTEGAVKQEAAHQSGWVEDDSVPGSRVLAIYPQYKTDPEAGMTVDEEDGSKSLDADAELSRNSSVEEEEGSKHKQSRTRRFKEVEVEDIPELIATKMNKRTEKSTKQHVNICQEFLKTKGEERPIEAIEPYKLDTMLSLFFLAVVKLDGTEYEPVTLKCIQNSLRRHLDEKDYGFDIMKHKEFTKSQEAIKSRIKELRLLGKGRKSDQRRRAPTTGELAMLFQSGALGLGNPRSLQHTMWWNLQVHFGFKASWESYNLRWGDLSVLKDNYGRKMLILDGKYKLECSAEKGHKFCTDKVYALQNQSDPICPIRVYEQCFLHRPNDMRHALAPFFLQPVDRAATAPHIWYKSARSGINSVKHYISEIKKQAGLEDENIWPPPVDKLKTLEY